MAEALVSNKGVTTEYLRIRPLTYGRRTPLALPKKDFDVDRAQVAHIKRSFWLPFIVVL
ncbi:hypothetical protein [Rhizobium sp. BK379]|uniref:hypothetical protein n=1 Tax=Rhizobium sp. BK379 TaxID=2587059 RepID=UPI00160BAA3B|nr:hypothetical protein [Rhizobium sp. BK379]MBB3447235.1 hypothetical protein [Rhizobium sp. BK379]